jgi:RHS repeat-associated protein
MAGISSKAAGKLENRYKFNDGTELTNDFDLNLYETQHRGYDPQIGRFWQIDELADEYEDWSPYVFSLNNPIMLNDPTGLYADSVKNKSGEWVYFDNQDLENVTVTAVKKTGSVYHGLSIYYSMMDYTGGDLSRIVNDQFRNEMYRYQGIAEYRERVNAMTRESDAFALEYGSYFIPVGAGARFGGAVLKWGAGKIITAAGMRVLKKAVANPALSKAMKDAMARHAGSNLEKALLGKGIDFATRKLADKNLILRAADKLGLIKMGATNKGPDIIGRGFMEGRYWDFTTPKAWQAHINKYAAEFGQGTPLLY